MNQRRNSLDLKMEFCLHLQEEASLSTSMIQLGRQICSLAGERASPLVGGRSGLPAEDGLVSTINAVQIFLNP